MSDGQVIALMVGASILLGILFGFSMSVSDITQDCVNLQSFHHADRIYDCKVREK